MPVTIDVIIPSFRFNPETLLPILNLEKPADARIRFYLISDNPAVIPHQSIIRLIDDQTFFLIINEINEGASATRNKGIENSRGDWVLFLDDDIEVSPDLLITYANAITQNPGEIGFIGLVDMPPPPTYFAQAVDANGSNNMFTIAKKKPSFAWGVTANIMISREAIGEVRFSDRYPKTGGGEDVEFFIRARELNNFKNYKCLESARVTHPWWRNGKPDFERFFGYGKGISFLPGRNPLYRSYDFLNTSETLLITIIIFFVFLFADFKDSYLVLYFIALVIFLEYLISLLLIFRNKKSFSPLVAVYVMLLRYSADSGVLFGNLLRYRIIGIGERFHFNGQLKKAYFTFNTSKIIKLIVYLSTIIYMLIRLF